SGGDQMSQGAELQLLLVTASAVSCPEIVQPAIGHRELQQSPHRDGQRELLQHGRGKEAVVHDSRNPGKTQGDVTEKFLIPPRDPTRYAKTLNSLPCQVVRTARRVVYRLLSWNPWQGVFFRLVERLHGMRLC